jgi:hypothetical protein
MASVVVIRCPETDEEVATGFVADLYRFGNLPDRGAVLCSACRGEHSWTKADAYLSIRLSVDRDGAVGSMVRRTGHRRLTRKKKRPPNGAAW